MGILDGLLPASFRGVPFFVSGIANRVGRRTVVHEYPGRDEVWVEDLGAGPKIFSFLGFLAGIEPSLQHAAMLAAVNKPGSGTLTHPSLGIFSGMVVTFDSRESKDALGVYELQFQFIESAEAAEPSAADDLGGMLVSGRLNLLSASSSAFVSSVIAPLGIGAAVLSQMGNVLTAWAELPLRVVGDARAVAGAVQGLAGSFGRYDSGLGTPAAPADATAESLLAARLAAGGAVVASAGALAATMAEAPPGDIATAVQSLAETARQATRDPADQIRLLTPMAAYVAPPAIGTGPIGVAIAAVDTAAAALCRRAALAEIAAAVALYVPDSFDQAVAQRTALADLFEAEITAAADAGDSDVMAALRDLRATVMANLLAVGAGLAPLRSFHLPGNASALATAQHLYQDGTRAADLAARSNAVHPAFLPTDFTALAS